MRGAAAVHDAALVAWAALVAARAAGRPVGGGALPLAVAVNLVSGTPMAWRRARAGRRDLPALLAPAAVGCGVVATARPRPRWAPVAATALLVALRAAERARSG